MNIFTTVKEDVKINTVFNCWSRYEESWGYLCVCVKTRLKNNNW